MVDLINLHAALHDALVDCGVLIDDHSGIIVSTDGSRVRHDKENPRIDVVITRICEMEE
jgi:Holliday junction resolvase RusA-like endonuclease